MLSEMFNSIYLGFLWTFYTVFFDNVKGRFSSDIHLANYSKIVSATVSWGILQPTKWGTPPTVYSGIVLPISLEDHSEIP